MKQRLYIHIGRPKAGSSALQHFLDDNRGRLLARGVCYPETGMHHQASHKLSFVFLPDLPGHSLVEGVAARDLYDELIEEIKSSGVSRAIISSENFWFVDPKRLPSRLRREFDVKIVCYARRQDDVVVSSFIQEVKAGKVALDQDMGAYMENPARRRYLDYDAMLGGWARVFGRDNVLVRLFGADRSGIENDILSVLSLEWDDAFVKEETRVNASPARDVLELITEVYRFPRGGISPLRIAEPFVVISEVMGYDAAYDARRLITIEDRRRILALFAESNRRLRQTYFPGRREPLFPEPEGVADLGRPDPERDFTRFRQIMAGLFAYQQRTNIQLRRRLNGQAERLKRLEAALGVQPPVSNEQTQVRVEVGPRRSPTRSIAGLTARLMRKVFGPGGGR